jgi:hypothetical protein
MCAHSRRGEELLRKREDRLRADDPSVKEPTDHPLPSGDARLIRTP